MCLLFQSEHLTLPAAAELPVNLKYLHVKGADDFAGWSAVQLPPLGLFMRARLSSRDVTGIVRAAW